MRFSSSVLGRIELLNKAVNDKVNDVINLISFV